MWNKHNNKNNSKKKQLTQTHTEVTRWWQKCPPGETICTPSSTRLGKGKQCGLCFSVVGGGNPRVGLRQIWGFHRVQ